jgi:hypothetical protein
MSSKTWKRPSSRRRRLTAAVVFGKRSCRLCSPPPQSRSKPVSSRWLNKSRSKPVSSRWLNRQIVPCPHIGNSITVDRNCAVIPLSSIASTKAVAGIPISRAILPRWSASIAEASQITAAWLPPKAVSEKAS